MPKRESLPGRPAKKDMNSTAPRTGRWARVVWFAIMWDRRCCPRATTAISGSHRVPDMSSSKPRRSTIPYQFTVEDPGMWTRPWSGEIPVKKIAGPLWEYACHEANYGLENTLRGARVEDAEAAKKTK